jgi:pilus assembly protein CpaC
VELREGQHLAIAGLLDRTIQENIQKLPFLGDIPILGRLFQNRDERQEVSELLVIVSPTIVTPSDEVPELPTGDPADWDWNERLRDLATDSTRSGR